MNKSGQGRPTISMSVSRYYRHRQTDVTETPSPRINPGPVRFRWSPKSMSQPAILVSRANSFRLRTTSGFAIFDCEINRRGADGSAQSRTA
jgi:hypothetical protein